MKRMHTFHSGWLVLLIVLAAVLPYLGTLQADFVWDDDLLVVDHAYYRHPDLFWSLWTRNLIFSPNYWRPLGLLTFYADFQVHGDATPTGGYGLGAAVASGDLNADGIDDLIVGDPDRAAGALARAGRVYVFFGRANRPRQRAHVGTVEVGDVGRDVERVAGVRHGHSLARQGRFRRWRRCAPARPSRRSPDPTGTRRCRR